MFLTFLGNDGYSLLRDLCIPIKPIDKGYDSLKELLSNYINPKPNLLTVTWAQIGGELGSA